MTTLHLIRHGQTNWNLEKRIQGQTDSVLTDTGIEQAKNVAEELKSIPFTAAYSSSSVRAKDTAKAILKHHPLDLSVRDDMREIFLGDWEGRLYADVAMEDPDNHNHFSKHPSKFDMPGAETFYQVQERALNVVQQLIKQHSAGDVLLVSHGLWIKTILVHFEQRPMQNLWHPPTMGNCCHSIIEFNQDQAKIAKYAGLSEW